MGSSLFFKLFSIFSLLGLLEVNISYGQDKQIEYDTMNVDGEVRKEEVIEEQIIEAPETKTADEIQKKQIQDINKELEETTKEINEEVVEIKDEQPEPPREIKEEVVEVNPPKEEPKPFYEFLFDDSEPSLFKTKAKWKSFGVGIGFLQYFPGSYQMSSNSSEKNNDFETALELSLEFGEVNGWGFIPFLGFTAPKKSDDGYFSKFHYNLGFEGAYRFTDNFRGKLGTTILFTTIKGELDGQVDVDGNPFFAVGGGRTSILNTIDFGLEYWIQKISLSWRSSVTSAFESEKTNFIHGVFIKYNFDFSKKAEVSNETPID